MLKKTTCIFAVDEKDFLGYELSVKYGIVEIKHEDYPFVDFKISMSINEWKELNEFVNNQIEEQKD